MKKVIKKDNYLWFVNTGAYDADKLAELHEFGLIIAKSKSMAKYIAKNRWIKNGLKKHVDNLSQVDNLVACDNCFKLDNIDGWEIKLTKDPSCTNLSIKPDWYGYWRIDTV